MAHHNTRRDNLGASMAAPSISLSSDEQERYEHEGAAAGLAGKTRADSPYEEGTFEWTFWFYGFQQASCELLMAKNMTFVFSISENPPSDFDLQRSSAIPVRQAIENGAWKPRYVTLAMLDEIERGPR